MSDDPNVTLYNVITHPYPTFDIFSGKLTFEVRDSISNITE